MQQLQQIEQITGQGTSMVTLLIPPTSLVSHITKFLKQEASSCTNIKNKNNRKSVQSALQSALTRIKAITKIGPNGLALFMSDEYCF